MAFKKKKFFFYLIFLIEGQCLIACQIIIPQSGLERMSLALEVQSLSH